MLERVRAEHDQELDFPLLSDPGSTVIGRYGLLNPDGRGWPHPTVFLVDRDGVVRWRFMEVDYRVRATNEDILAALAELRSMSRQDVTALRDAGLDDRATLETVEVTAYFNFVNRLADGLGVALEHGDES